MSKVLVFVYGTLKTGLGNHRCMIDAKGVSLGPARTVNAPFVLVNGYSYPYSVHVTSKQSKQLQQQGIQPDIRGELFEVEESGMTNILDRLEGYPHHYNRTEITVCMRSGMCDERTAWMYHRNESLQHDEPVCSNGEWWPAIRLVNYCKAKPLAKTWV